MVSHKIMYRIVWTIEHTLISAVPTYSTQKHRVLPLCDYLSSHNSLQHEMEASYPGAFVLTPKFSTYRLENMVLCSLVTVWGCRAEEAFSRWKNARQVVSTQSRKTSEKPAIYFSKYCASYNCHIYKD